MDVCVHGFQCVCVYYSLLLMCVLKLGWVKHRGLHFTTQRRHCGTKSLFSLLLYKLLLFLILLFYHKTRERQTNSTAWHYVITGRPTQTTLTYGSLEAPHSSAFHYCLAMREDTPLCVRSAPYS